MFEADGATAAAEETSPLLDAPPIRPGRSPSTTQDGASPTAAALREESHRENSPVSQDRATAGHAASCTNGPAKAPAPEASAGPLSIEAHPGNVPPALAPAPLPAPAPFPLPAAVTAAAADTADEEVAAASACVQEALAALSRLDTVVRAPQAWSGVQRTSLLAGVERVRAALVGPASRVLLAHHDTPGPRRPGQGSTVVVVAAVTRVDEVEVRKQLSQGEALADMPSIARDVTEGLMPVGHLAVLAQVRDRASGSVRNWLASPAGQDTVTALARLHEVRAFRRALVERVAAIDPPALEADHQGQRRARSLVLSDRPDGTHLRGRIDLMAGARLRRALEATGEAPDEDRSPEQAAADALDAIASRILDLPETGSGAAVRPHVSLILGEDTLAALHTHAQELLEVGLDLDGAGTGTADETTGTGTGTGTGAGAVRTAGSAWAGLAACPPAVLEEGPPVPPSEVTRILCDSRITRVVMDADRVPLDVGRTQRLYTGEIRRAVFARDRHCAYPGCTRPPQWGEVHHIRWWSHGGGTSVQNAVLLCLRHHHLVHEDHLTIRRLPPGPAHPATGSTRRRDLLPQARYEFCGPDGAVVGRTSGSAWRGADATTSRQAVMSWASPQADPGGTGPRPAPHHGSGPDEVRTLGR